MEVRGGWLPDGRSVVSTLTMRAFLNLTYVVLFELMPDPTWDFDSKGEPRKTRQNLVRALAWPDELAEDDAREAEAEHADGQVAAKSHGFGVSDRQFAEAWEVYKEAVAARDAAAAAAPPQPGAEAPE